MPDGVPVTVNFGVVKDPVEGSTRVSPNFRAIDAAAPLHKDVSEAARGALAGFVMDSFGWDLRLRAHKKHLPHRRKLTVRFTSGRELQLCLDKGFDWLSPVGPVTDHTRMLPGEANAAAWKVREETFIVVMKRPDE